MPKFDTIVSKPNKPFLVTGGAGYIGAHVVKFLTEVGISCVVFDIDENSTNVKSVYNREIEFGDIRSKSDLLGLFSRYDFEGVIHLAALKSVEDSQKYPEEYLGTNVMGTSNLLEVMNAFKVRKIIFSSSAAVYKSSPDGNTVNELSPICAQSIYGDTKIKGENLVRLFSSNYGISSIIFRYFNVAGSDSPLLKDKSVQNLIPIVIEKIKKGIKPEIFGNDYETPDGTAIRDYVDVRDIARAHVNAITFLSKNQGSYTFNLGTGVGASVSEVVKLIKEVIGSDIEPVIKGRRNGDISSIVANCEKARNILGFKSRYSLREMIEASI